MKQRNWIKNSLKPAAVALLCFALLLPSLTTHAEEDPYEPKIYSNATVEQEFDDSRILVVLDKRISKVNKKLSKNFFGFLKDAKITDLTQIEGNIAEKNIDEENFRQILEIQLPENSKQNVLKVIKQLEKIPGIKYAGPDYVLEEPVTAVPSTTNATVMRSATTDLNISVDGTWALRKINAYKAWNITEGSKDVKVGVIDSGIAAHPELTANTSTTLGKDFYIPPADDPNASDPTITTDDSGHGTTVAGVIGAIGSNNFGSTGLNRNVTLVPLQIEVGYQNDGSAYSSRISLIIEAIAYAINNNIPILTISTSGPNYSEALKQAIQNYPGLFVCAAGGKNYLTFNLDVAPQYPACYNLPNMITVGASLEDDSFASVFSNYGKNFVHIFAPGDNIVCPFPANICDLGNCTALTPHITRGYHLVGGTSIAAPFVTGVAALMLSVNPTLTTSQLKSIILESGDTVAGLSDYCSTGKRLNAYNAVKTAAVYFEDFSLRSSLDDWKVFGGGDLSIYGPNPHLDDNYLVHSRHEESWYSPYYNIYPLLKEYGPGRYRISLDVRVNKTATPDPGHVRLIIRGTRANSFILDQTGSGLYYCAVTNHVPLTAGYWIRLSGVIDVQASDIAADTGSFRLMLDSIRNLTDEDPDSQTVLIDNVLIEKRS